MTKEQIEELFDRLAESLTKGNEVYQSFFERHNDWYELCLAFARGEMKRLNQPRPKGGEDSIYIAEDLAHDLFLDIHKDLKKVKERITWQLAKPSTLLSRNKEPLSKPRFIVECDCGSGKRAEALFSKSNKIKCYTCSDCHAAVLLRIEIEKRSKKIKERISRELANSLKLLLRDKEPLSESRFIVECDCGSGKRAQAIFSKSNKIICYTCSDCHEKISESLKKPLICKLGDFIAEVAKKSKGDFESPDRKLIRKEDEDIKNANIGNKLKEIERKCSVKDRVIFKINFAVDYGIKLDLSPDEGSWRPHPLAPSAEDVYRNLVRRSFNGDLDPRRLQAVLAEEFNITGNDPANIMSSWKARAIGRCTRAIAGV